MEREAAELSPAIPWSQIQGGPAHLGTSDTPELSPPLEEAWRLTPDEGGGLSAPVIAGDTVFSFGRTKVYSVDLETGELNWSIDREEGPITAPVVFESADRLGGALLAYVEGKGDETQVTAIAVDTQKTAWTMPLEEDSLSGLTATADQILVTTKSGTVTSVDSSTGKETWSVLPLPGPIDSAPAVDEAAVYFPVRSAKDGTLSVIAIDLLTGEQKWRKAVGLLGSTSSTLTVSDGRVFAVIPGFASGEVYSFSTEDGSVIWKTGVRSPVFPFSGLAVSQGHLFIADLSGGIYSLSAEDASRSWDFQVNGTTQQRSAPLVVPGFVFGGFDDGRIAAVATGGGSQGHLVWSTDTGSGAVKLMALSPDELVAAIGGDDGGLVALRHATGDEELLDVASPTQIDPAGVLLAYLGALLLVGGSALAVGKLLGDRMAGAGSKGRDDDYPDDADDDDGEED